MKRRRSEKSLVIVLFILVMVAFSLAERDTKKLFEKYNTKSTVLAPERPMGRTAQIAERPDTSAKFTRN